MTTFETTRTTTMEPAHAFLPPAFPAALINRRVRILWTERRRNDFSEGVHGEYRVLETAGEWVRLEYGTKSPRWIRAREIAEIEEVEDLPGAEDEA